MLSAANTAAQDLQTYANALRFPRDLEREFRRDFGERQPPMLKRFFALGLALYMSFAVLDYFAMTTYYPTAWALRLVFGTAMLRLVFDTETAFFKRNIVWLPSAWTLLAATSILIMIFIARSDEPAYLFYAFGLLLIIVATYIPSSGDLLYPSLAGWATVLAYLAVGIFHQHMLDEPELARTFLVISFFLVGMNILCMIGGSMLVFSQRRDFLQRRLIEEQRSAQENLHKQADQLLLNILPVTVAERLKRGEVIADLYDEASILFADVVNFTPFSSHLVLHDLVAVLNDLISEFDIMAKDHGLERIKTTGDGYMLAAGVPEPRADHAEAITHLGLEFCEYVRNHTYAGQKLGLRVGISSGPVVAAVIGLQRFSYDVWGDTVNTASRMCTHGLNGVVQITEATYRLVCDRYECVPGGLIDVKGKGGMNVWHVLRAR
ncbi:MAG TPA: adenylate/guanylate cyclase domain-containing protein [Anaerolineales bacterium]